MKAKTNAACARLARIGLVALSMGAAACADVDREHEQEGMTSAPSENDADVSTMQQALDAQQAAQATAVATTIAAPFIGAGNNAALGTTLDQAIKGLQARFGACITTTRSLAQAKGNITVVYTDCTGPFEALTFSGSSNANYDVDASTGTTKLTLLHDLTIAAAGGAVKAVSNMSTDLDVAGQSAVVDTNLSVTGPGGTPNMHAGKLEVELSGTCASATLTGDSPTLQTHLQISGMTFCADGSACVQGVELQGPQRKISLDVSPGGGGVFSFSGPQAGTKTGSLPAGTELCVRP